MQIQVNTDNHIKGSNEFFAKVSAEVERGLSRFADQITRVEVHLADVNGPREGGADKRCLLEARLAGRQPIVVTHEAATLDESIVEACDKLERAIESLLGRLDPKGQTSFGGDQVI
ncbi:HPF/RaiA family ribosome-associated protein [Singulisphaera sp. Ch08]|uniref:HPF/RaiA family ribosome-associated protein n=1 Tax=Singulisphaera sp. Ch08 TaxID=3120278 RepID=A0AAU7CGG4_9BACT